MANYIGNQIKNGDFKKLDDLSSSFNGSTTTFNLTFGGTPITVGDAAQLLVSLNGVIQEPVTTFTLGNGGNQIVFAAAPSNGASCFILFIGGIGGAAATIKDGIVTSTKLVDGAVTTAKLDSTIDLSGKTVTYGNLPAANLTGTLPAIDGSALTGIDALPSQTGQNGNYLTTDGTNATWAALDTDANSTTKGMYEHSASISANYSIASGNNAMSAGPVTIDTGITVTIPAGSNWTIV